MKRNDNAIEKIYDKDPSTDSYIIAVAIDKYADIFNELDPAPFRSRDLDNDLRAYLEDSSADIPFNHDIILQFNFFGENQDLKREEKISFGLKNYFSFVEKQLAMKLTSLIRKAYSTLE